jgi:uncharacterized membrane protein
MLKLYRGLVDIFIKQSLVQEQEFVKHVRSDTPAVAEEGTIGTRGFWNLMLEIVFVLFTKIVFLFGLIIVCALAMVSFPLYGVWQGIVMMINHRAAFEPVMLEEPAKQEPKLEKK